MQEQLIRKFHEYIRENNPDVLVTLQDEGRVTDYLLESLGSVNALVNKMLADGKAPSMIEEVCMKEMTAPLRPSRYNYLKELLEEEFPQHFEKFYLNGVLTIELINMVSACDDVFDELIFSEKTEDDRLIRYAITGVVHEYLSKT